MNISSYNLVFQANFNSKKLNFSNDDFFVRIYGYGKNSAWADKIKETADTAVTMIRKDTSPENVLKFISTGVRTANQLDYDVHKKKFSSVLRCERENWSCQDGCELITPYGKNKYRHYAKKLDKVFRAPLFKPPMTECSRPYIYRETGNKEIRHAGSWCINDCLTRVFELSKKIFPKFIQEEIKPVDLPEVNSTIAEIRWMLAHSTPWIRGSDAISNVFIRAIYKAIGVKAYPLKKGVSLDLEAFCTELKDYKTNFTNYFEKEPAIVE